MPSAIIGIIIAVTATAASLVVSVVVSRKQDRLANRVCDPNAAVQSKCMVREGSVHAPGVATICGGTLSIQTVLGRSLAIPLDQIEVTKETIGIGWYPWIGKAVFKLRSPRTAMLAIGVKRSEARRWRDALLQSGA